jgi:ferredoxin
MKQKIIKIDESLCNGCGSCVKGCHGGALKLVDGKARIIDETFCDGLGACIGECPLGAIKFEERDIEINAANGDNAYQCPGSMAMSFKHSDNKEVDNTVISSQLSQWPVQLFLLNPQAPYFKEADVVLAADCPAYAFGNFHNSFLKNRTLAIACPKLDSWKDEYVEKIKIMVDISKINTLTVVMIEVPCCVGLLQIAQRAIASAERKIPVKKVIIGIKGDILNEEWM